MNRYIEVMARAMLRANGSDYSWEETVADPKLKPAADWATELSEAALEALAAGLAEDGKKVTSPLIEYPIVNGEVMHEIRGLAPNVWKMLHDAATCELTGGVNEDV